MDRRRYLALIGATTTLAIAGCAGEEDDGDGDDSDDAPADDGDDTDPAADDADDTADDGGDDGDPDDGEDDPPDDSADDDADDGPDDDPDDDDEDTPERSPADTLASIRDFAAEDYFDGSQHVFEGVGQTVTDEFSLAGVLTVVLFDHDGESNFQVSLEGATTEPALVNHIGAIEGATAFATDFGDHLADINADGNWSLTFAQPLAFAEDVRTLPVSASGEGQDVVGPVELPGGVTVSGEHDGESNFQVSLYDEDASGFRGRDIVFNEIGEFEGEARADLEGVAWVDVNADGEWSLEIDE